MAEIRNTTEIAATTMRRAVAMLVALIALTLHAYAASEAKQLRGVALVIGNGAYEHLPALANPEHDARAIEELLADLGFETELSSDRDARRLGRDLEDFVEDAEGADVAIIYYAGHGIEAGGENYLVPVDADASSLDAVGEKLVPISEIIAQLRATVAVTIVMLDACRDNPFPAGATLLQAPGSEPLPVSASGLAVGSTRGATSLSRGKSDQPADNSLGIVIGFAAEPRQAALDGTPGANSPYAAAILRHLAAMAGEDFGTVMRMVAEEVWLKTGGRQRPWVNESLRRLLYFGEAPQQPSGVEGDITRERRTLLLTISDLPDFGRSQIKRIAAQNDVPMDALFGLLKAMGSDAPSDPVQLEKTLKAESARIRDILTERDALANPDPEVARLTAMADSAEREGLIDSAKKLRAQAKTRDAEFQAQIVDRAEEQVRTQRIASAQVYARSAETYLLAYDHLDAARDFGQAYDRVERWDANLAWRYKFEQFRALTNHGELQGDRPALEQSLQLGQEAQALAVTFDDREDWARTRNEVGHALRKLGELDTGTERLVEAVAAFNDAAKYRSRETSPLEWAETQADRARALVRIAERETSSEHLYEGIAAYRAALEVFPRQDAPQEWADIYLALGGALAILGDRQTASDSFHDAAIALETALEELSPTQDPVLWSTTHDSLGTVYAYIAERSGEIALFEKAIEHLLIALQSAPREQFPALWANTSNNLGVTFRVIAMQVRNPEYYVTSVAHMRNALEVWTRELAPMDWARGQSNMAVSLMLMNDWQDGIEGYEAAITALRGALEVWTRDRIPVEWANGSNSLALALQRRGDEKNNVADMREAVVLYRSVLEVWTHDTLPIQWAKTQHNLGVALAAISRTEGTVEPLREAETAFAAALEVRTPQQTPTDWAHSAARLGITRATLAYGEGNASALRDSRQLLEQAIAQFRQIGNLQTADDYQSSVGKIDDALARMGESNAEKAGTRD